MKQLISIILSAVLVTACSSGSSNMASPDGKITVELNQDSTGVLRYVVKNNGQAVLEPSALGLKLNDADFSHLEIVSTGSKREVNGSYTTPAEKRRNNTFRANEWDVKVKNPEGREMTLRFHLSDNGVAFRYQIDGTAEDAKTVEKEFTSFKFPQTAKAYLHPHDNVKDGWEKTYPSYEANYMTDIPAGTPAPRKAGWSFPALFKSGENWVLLTEAGLEPPYCGTRLGAESPEGEYFIEFPQTGETVNDGEPITPISKLPIVSPWRVIMTGQLAGIVESSMVTDLAAPCRIANIDYVKPGFAAWSWGLEQDESVNYDRQIQFIDYAATMTWEYVLIDVSWDRTIGYDRMQQLIDYARSKNVGIILWYNSAGNWNTAPQTPRSALLTHEDRQKEFERISRMGVAGVKVDFWPGDGPSAIQYYYDLIQDAAGYKLLVNCHGATAQRGWGRTFPNLVTMEGVRGFEFIVMLQEVADMAPQHCATLVFTRNVVGAMDFTPVFFGDMSFRKRSTSNGFEIALTVLFQSGIQHFVESPENMVKQPDYVQEYMKHIPRVWDDVKLIDGYPAKYAVIARRSGDKWYVGGVNAEMETKSLNLDLSALNIQKEGVMITDGDTNRDFSTKKVNLNHGKLQVEIQPNGGFVIEF
ncbi:MAG: glycoside hydrolase family 97 protein [Dysgonamonadaceae bacterium]|jgi:hypothetical protein|nr:glycoside hydrolase family 97 protein [Dysgonamonadaceae bacterium]